MWHDQAANREEEGSHVRGLGRWPKGAKGPEKASQGETAGGRETGERRYETEPGQEEREEGRGADETSRGDREKGKRADL